MLNLIGPARKYGCYLLVQTYPLTRCASVHHPANIRTVKEEQDPRRAGTGAEHGTLPPQHGQPSELYITVHLLMHTTTGHCISQHTNQPPRTGELSNYQHGEHKP